MRRRFSLAILGALAGFLACSSEDDASQAHSTKDAGSDVVSANDSGSDTSSEGDAAGECSTHADCEPVVGGPARCVNEKCVAIQTKECPCVPNVPDEVWRDENSILVGAFAGSCADPLSANYQLAVRELNATSLLPPIALVVCDNGATSLGALTPRQRLEAVQTAAQHLTSELAVPSVLAALHPDDLVPVFESQGLPTGTFFFTPYGADSTSAALADNQLLWHMLGTGADFADTYTALIERMESVVPTLLGKPAPLRILVLAASDTLSTELEPALAAKAAFNGASWAQNLADGNLEIESVTAGSGVTAAVQTIATFDPHIVISIGESPIVEVWDTAEGNADRFWILSPANFGDLQFLMTAVAAAGPSELHDRFVFVNPAGTEDVDLRDAYRSRLSAAFPGTPLDFENAYDATYYLAYSQLSTGAPGMPALFAPAPAAQLDVGPDDISQVVGILDTPGGKLHLNGLMGPPNFDAATGIRRSTGMLGCIRQFFGSYDFNVHVGHFDDDTKILRKAQVWDGIQVPCLDWLALPDP